MGMPSSGFFTPRASSASAARAAASPRSKSRTQIALILASCRSIRLIASSASSTAETFLAARAADISTAVLKLHCDLAKVHSRSGCSMLAADDAQFAAAPQEQWLHSGGPVASLRSWRKDRSRASLATNKKRKQREAPMRSAWIAGAVIAVAIGSAATGADAAEIRLAEQFSMGYLQFNVMKRDRLIEKYATQRGLKDFKVSWQRFNGPVAMNEALLSNSTDIVSGGVPGLITLWDKTQGTSFEVKGICALSSQPFLLNTANPDIKSIKDFGERDRIGVPSVKVSVQAVVLQMAAAAAFGEENFAKLDALTVSMSPPDATIALLSGSGNINTVFSVPPFQFQQLEQNNIRTVLSSFEVLGPHTFTVAWTSARFRKDNPELYAAFLDAGKEAPATVTAEPERTAQGWIDASKSKLPLEMVTKVVSG